MDTVRNDGDIIMGPLSLRDVFWVHPFLFTHRQGRLESHLFMHTTVLSFVPAMITVAERLAMRIPGTTVKAHPRKRNCTLFFPPVKADGDFGQTYVMTAVRLFLDLRAAYLQHQLQLAIAATPPKAKKRRPRRS